MTDSLHANLDSSLVIINQQLHYQDSTLGFISSKQSEILFTLEKIEQGNNSYSYLLIGALIGSIFGLLLTLLWEFIRTKRKNHRIKQALKQYEGLYLSFNKYDDAKQKVFRCFELKRQKNKLIIKNGISLLGYEDFFGEINLSDFNLKHGTGYFQHFKDPKSWVGFGFLEVQLADIMILAHEIIFNKENKQNCDPYRWIKQDAVETKAIVSKHREIQQSKYKTKYGD